MALFSFDALALFFLGVIALVSLPSAVYSVGYLQGECGSFKKTLAWCLLALFLASMGVVVATRNVLVFLVAWELMSLSSYFFVVFETTHERSIQAGTIYIVMTHIGSAFLIAAFMVLYHFAHTFDYIGISKACAVMPVQVKNTVFLLFLVGFGTKAGIVPLHIWLPYAHPQAPSHISSIMSGVMIKTAVYGIIRFVIGILGVQDRWWGALLLVLAVITCLVGIIYALMERDLKRLLAYSSVENMGIILLGVGLSMYFLSMHMVYAAVFALIAGLYHLVNHAIFKGLLFLGAGSVYKATGTRDIEKLGGLIKRMPYTAVYFLVGSMAISALPPFCGFVSEWLMLQSFFLGALQAPGGSRLFLGICAAMLALTGGLAAACFVKAFGITFLGLPRSHYAAGAKEVSFSMRAGMCFLAVLALLFGLGATVMMRLLASVAGAATGIDCGNMRFSLNNFILAPQTGNQIYLCLPALACLLVVFGAAALGWYLWCGKGKVTRYATWDCGYYKLEPRNEYTATAFSKPFMIAFNFFLLPYRKTQKIRDSFYLVKSFAYETHTTPVFKKYIYEPVLSLVFKSARFMKRMQPGSIHLYLGYILAVVLLLIAGMGKL